MFSEMPQSWKAISDASCAAEEPKTLLTHLLFYMNSKSIRELGDDDMVLMIQNVVKTRISQPDFKMQVDIRCQRKKLYQSTFVSLLFCKSNYYHFSVL
jgi:hypothetical protein